MDMRKIISFILVVAINLGLNACSYEKTFHKFHKTINVSVFLDKYIILKEDGREVGKLPLYKGEYVYEAINFVNPHKIEIRTNFRRNVPIILEDICNASAKTNITSSKDNSNCSSADMMN